MQKRKKVLTLAKRRVVLCLVMFILSSCASQEVFDRAKKKRNEVAGHEKTFVAPLEVVWKACQRSLKYPISIDNMEHGVLETDWIKGEDSFVPAQMTESPSSGVRSKISIRLIKGKVKQKEAFRVSLTKQIERQKDFFTPTEELYTDGIEEKILLYRIEREILIDEVIKRGSYKSLRRN